MALDIFKVDVETSATEVYQAGKGSKVTGRVDVDALMAEGRARVSGKLRIRNGGRDFDPNLKLGVSDSIVAVARVSPIDKESAAVAIGGRGRPRTQDVVMQSGIEGGLPFAVVGGVTREGVRVFGGEIKAGRDARVTVVRSPFAQGEINITLLG